MQKKRVANSKKYAVTFEMPPEVAGQSLNLVGDFNNWDSSATPMKRLKDGSWAATLRLAPGDYRYRYLADGHSWENDRSADRYEPSGFGSDNCVVIVDTV